MDSRPLEFEGVVMIGKSLWVGLGLLGTVAHAWAADVKPSAENSGPATWYVQAMARGEGGLNLTRFWSKGSKLRAETAIRGHKVVSIVNGNFYYAYDAIRMVGVVIRRSAGVIAADSPDRRPFGHELEAMLEVGAEKIREEMMLGVLCDVYRITDDAGRRTLWVTHDHRQLSARLEIWNRATGATTSTDFFDWLGGLSIEDAFFEPEPAIQLERFELEDYMARLISEGSVGPIPVLFPDLLHGGDVEGASK